MLIAGGAKATLKPPTVIKNNLNQVRSQTRYEEERWTTTAPTVLAKIGVIIPALPTERPTGEKSHPTPPTALTSN